MSNAIAASVLIYELNAGFSDVNLRRNLRTLWEKFDTLNLSTTVPTLTIVQKKYISY